MPGHRWGRKAQSNFERAVVSIHLEGRRSLVVEAYWMEVGSCLVVQGPWWVARWAREYCQMKIAAMLAIWTLPIVEGLA